MNDLLMSLYFVVESFVSAISQMDMFKFNFVYFLVILTAVVFSFKIEKLKSVIITLGILGTFFGITVGLLNFDPNKLEESIVNLLNGLKTAFFTSIVSMIGVIFITIFQKKKTYTNNTEVLNAINDSIKEQTEVLKFYFEEQNKIIYKTVKNELFEVLEQNDTRLTELLKDEFKKTNETLKNAIKELSKSATDEMIKSLKVVIENFNNDLNEQFGDNFKELNSAVKELIVWQENYKANIENLQKSLTDTFKQIEDSAKEIKNISSEFSTINQVFKELETVIKTNENQLNNLQEHLNTLSKIGKEAQLYIDEIAKFSETTKESLSNQSAVLQKLTEENARLISEIESQLPKSLNELNIALTSLTNKFKDDYEFFLKEISKIIKFKEL